MLHRMTTLLVLILGFISSSSLAQSGLDQQIADLQSELADSNIDPIALHLDWTPQPIDYLFDPFADRPEFIQWGSYDAIDMNWNSLYLPENEDSIYNFDSSVFASRDFFRDRFIGLDDVTPESMAARLPQTTRDRIQEAVLNQRAARSALPEFQPWDDFECATRLETWHDFRGVIVVLVGSHDLLPQTDNVLSYREGFDRLANEGFIICAGVSNEENWRTVLGSDYIHTIVFDGHGKDGGMTETELSSVPASRIYFPIASSNSDEHPRENLINARSFETSENLRLLVLNACQGGRADRQWESLAPYALILAFERSIPNSFGQKIARDIYDIVMTAESLIYAAGVDILTPELNRELTKQLEANAVSFGEELSESWGNQLMAIEDARKKAMEPKYYLDEIPGNRRIEHRVPVSRNISFTTAQYEVGNEETSSIGFNINVASVIGSWFGSDAPRRRTRPYSGPTHISIAPTIQGRPINQRPVVEDIRALISGVSNPANNPQLETATAIAEPPALEESMNGHAITETPEP